MVASIVIRDRSRGHMRTSVVTTMCWSALSVYSLLGCSGDTTGPAPLSPTQAFWALQFAQHAVNLALTAPAGESVPNTAQLSATPINANGMTLPGTYTVQYSTNDSIVTVSPTGLVTAHYNGVTHVVASLTIQGVTLRDIAVIQVTQTPLDFSVATFSMQPVVGDSAKRSQDFNQSQILWPVRAIDQHGDTVCDTIQCPLRVSYRSSNPAVATIDSTSGTVTMNSVGHTYLTATTLAYGQVLRDSVAFTVGYKLNADIRIAFDAVQKTVSFYNSLYGVIDMGKANRKLVLGVGAVVNFWNFAPGSGVDVAFGAAANSVDTASTVTRAGITFPPTGNGNITPFSCDTMEGLCNFVNGSAVRSRRFSAQGTYPYYSTVFPSDTAAIIVATEQ